MDAFSQLVREFQDLAMGTAYGWLGDVEAARDVSQETFLDAYVNLHQLREPEAFPGWLRRIVLKHCDRVTRRPRPEPWRDGHETPAGEVELEAGISAAEAAQQLRLAAQALPADERMVVALHYFAGLTGPELADFLDLPLSTIKSRPSRVDHQETPAQRPWAAA
jgi:RNA polymerase sigma factor (sigma-70 family)